MLVIQTHDSCGRTLGRSNRGTKGRSAAANKSCEDSVPGLVVLDGLDVMVGLAIPRHGRCESVEGLVGTGVVVPGADRFKVEGQVKWGTGLLPPQGESFFESTEEAFDSPVLPGAERVDALMPDADQGEGEEAGSEGGAVVRAEEMGAAVLFDGVEDEAENSNGGPVAGFAEDQAGTSPVIDQSEDGGFDFVASEIAFVRRPGDVLRALMSLPVLDVVSQAKDVDSESLEDSRDEGLSDAFVLSQMHSVERGRDVAATLEGQEGLETNDFLSDPFGFLGVAPARCFGRRRGCASTEPVPLVAHAKEDGGADEAQKDENEAREERLEHGICVGGRQAGLGSWGLVGCIIRGGARKGACAAPRKPAPLLGGGGVRGSARSARPLRMCMSIASFDARFGVFSGSFACSKVRPDGHEADRVDGTC